MNTGSETLNECGYLNSLKSRVWKDETGITNKLSFAESADQCHMTHDNLKEDAFQIKDWNRQDDSGIKFGRNHTSNSHDLNFQTSVSIKTA